MSNHTYSDLQAASGMGKKTLSAYISGFILCLILTIAAFLVVGVHRFSPMTVYLTIMILALIQLYVQVVFFLRLNTSREGIWNLTSFIFTIFVVAVVVGGSIWIMVNLNYYMMH